MQEYNAPISMQDYQEVLDAIPEPLKEDLEGSVIQAAPAFSLFTLKDSRILSVGSGRVSRIEVVPGRIDMADYNRFMDLDLESGLRVTYSHLGEPQVSLGEEVEIGDVLALQDTNIGGLDSELKHIHYFFFKKAGDIYHPERVQLIGPINTVE